MTVKVTDLRDRMQGNFPHLFYLETNWTIKCKLTFHHEKQWMHQRGKRRLVLVSGGNIPRARTQIHNESYGQIGLSKVYIHTHTHTYRTFPDISTDVRSFEPPEPCVAVTQRQPHHGDLLHPTYATEWKKQFKKERGSLSTFLPGKGRLGKIFYLYRHVLLCLVADAVIRYIFGMKSRHLILLSWQK